VPADTAGEQRDDEGVEADALALSLGGERGVQLDRETDAELA
jgi:hypothetical protein